MTNIVFLLGVPVLYRKQLMEFLRLSLIWVFLFLNKASASSMKRMVPLELFWDQSKTLLISWTLSMPRGLTFMIWGYRRSLTEWRSPSRCSNLFVLQIGSSRCQGGRRSICSSEGRCSFSCGRLSCWARPAAAAGTNLVWYFGRCFIP